MQSVNMIIDQNDTKWFIVQYGNTGLYYFNENGTFTDLTDDVENKLTTQ